MGKVHATTLGDEYLFYDLSPFPALYVHTRHLKGRLIVLKITIASVFVSEFPSSRSRKVTQSKCEHEIEQVEMAKTKGCFPSI